MRTRSQRYQISTKRIKLKVASSMTARQTSTDIQLTIPLLPRLQYQSRWWSAAKISSWLVACSNLRHCPIWVSRQIRLISAKILRLETEPPNPHIHLFLLSATLPNSP